MVPFLRSYHIYKKFVCQLKAVIASKFIWRTTDYPHNRFRTY